MEPELLGLVMITWNARTQAVAWGFGGALLAALVLIIALHIYADHQFLHSLAEAIRTQSQQPRPAITTPAK